MAEALLRQLSKGQIDVASAGSLPAPQVHPLAIATLDERYGIDTTGLHPKSLQTVLGRRFDYVITVCNRVAETCPVFPGDPERIHWQFENPTEVEGEQEQRRAFENVAAGLAGRLRIWMSLPDVRAHLQ